MAYARRGLGLFLVGNPVGVRVAVSVAQIQYRRRNADGRLRFEYISCEMSVPIDGRTRLAIVHARFFVENTDDRRGLLFSPAADSVGTLNQAVSSGLYTDDWTCVSISVAVNEL